MIEVSKLTRYFGDFPAVTDLDFRIEAGEVVGLVGRNGAGKSTILKMLAGVLLPSAGTIHVDGVDTIDAPPSARRRIGFLPEEAPLYRDMTVSDYLHFAGRLKGMSLADVGDQLPPTLEATQLTGWEDRVISEMSFGYRKRVGIAQAILHGPSLVILDEPASGLDPAQMVEMRQMIRDLSGKRTILLSSHILSEVTQTCDRILVVHEGEIVANASQDELVGRMSGQRILVDVRGSAEATQAALGGVEGVQSIVLGHDEGVTRIRIEQTEDHREEVAAALIRAGLGLRRLDEADGDLEKVFLGLTGGSGA